MNVVVPYANDISDPEVHYCVKLNLDLLGIDARWVRLTEPNSYSLLIIELWNAGEPFVLIEHDVIAWPGSVKEVWDCEEPFCGFDGTLCVAKLNPAALGECPVGSRTGWTCMDAEMHRVLYERGTMFHDHSAAFGRPAVTNLNRSNIPPRS